MHPVSYCVYDYLKIEFILLLYHYLPNKFLLCLANHNIVIGIFLLILFIENIDSKNQQHR